jgi:hypothetical protein
MPLPNLDGVAPLPEGAEELLRRMSHKEPEQRPEASEVRAALERLGEVRGPASSRLGVGLAVAGAVAAAVVVAALLLPTESPPAPVPPPPVVARPVPQPVEPVQPEPVQPEPAPAPAPSQVPGYDRSWACSEIVEVTPVLKDFWETRWRFFSVSFEYERALVVYADGTSKAQLRALAARREAVYACRGSAKLLAARRIDERHAPFRTDAFTAYGGLVAAYSDVTTVPAK